MSGFSTPNFETWQEALRVSFNQAFGDIVRLLPHVAAMLVVLVVGYIVARLLDKFAATLSHSLGLQTAAERSGLAASMQHVGITKSVPAIIGQIVFWMTMCVFLAAAFNILGLGAVSAAMEEIVAYIPNLLVATVVVVVGLLAAGFLRGVVATSADRVGITYAENLANAVYYVLALMTFIAAFDQLHIEFGLLKELILLAAAGLALGCGLALGFGGRDVMAGILAGYYLRQRMHAGDRIHVAGMEGTVREVGPVATVIETEEEGLLNRHSIPNAKMLNEAVR
ncbi:MAG TPA: mechanosensitive ion channel domain-containing protein [Pirellulales bacterium]|nr:mechanosensitive ion channel domain-containing protein [Pirellulales bacterium]